MSETDILEKTEQEALMAEQGEQQQRKRLPLIRNLQLRYPNVLPQ